MTARASLCFFFFFFQLPPSLLEQKDSSGVLSPLDRVLRQKATLPVLSCIKLPSHEQGKQTPVTGLEYRLSKMQIVDTALIMNSPRVLQFRASEPSHTL
ncbi:hypothetical protein V8C37DRAFT_17085 [Trichoderma ceciliae]